jgi:hypothetical protein
VVVRSCSARLEGRGIYDLLIPALLSSLRSIKAEVLGCVEELLKQLTPSKKSRRYAVLAACRLV